MSACENMRYVPEQVTAGGRRGCDVGREGSPVKRTRSGRAKKVNRNGSMHQFEQSLLRMGESGEGGIKRLKIAKKIGIEVGTADVTRPTLDTNHGKLSREQLQQKLVDAVLNAWHLHSKSSIQDLVQVVNDQLLKEIVCEEVSGFPDLDRCQDYLCIPNVKDRFEKERVDDIKVIEEWVSNKVISRKHCFTEQNDQAIMNERLSFARDLFKAMEDHNAIVIYLDVVPYSLTCAQNGRLVEFEAQVCFAVDAVKGMFFSECASSNENGETKPTVTTSTGNTIDTTLFKRFLDNLFASLLDWSDSELMGKKLYFIGDFPEDFVASAEASQSIYGVPAYHTLYEKLQQHGGKPFLIKTPACTPILNLGEFLNKPLRDAANEIYDRMNQDPSFRKTVLLSSRKEDEGKHVLEKVLGKALAILHDEALPSATPILLTKVLKDIIYDDGYLAQSTVKKSMTDSG